MNHELSKALAVFLLLVARASWAQTPAVPGKLVNVGGFRLHLDCTGTGSPTVVVAAGWFSFDWGLVQPPVARFTRICTYDPSGTAWSDNYPHGVPNCSHRVEELNKLLEAAAVEKPYVLVGFSIGGLYARLFAQQHPEQVAGMVLVDHAFIDTGEGSPLSVTPPPAPPSGDSPPVLISKTPIVLGLEDDENFQKLPQVDQELHRWAMSLHPQRPSSQMAAECSTIVDKAGANSNHPLGGIPLIVVSTHYDSPAYRELQAKLLSLSRDSRQIVAENSFHMVIIDQPELVVRAIREVVQAIRNKSRLP